MDIIPEMTQIALEENRLQQEVKPLKGINFDSDVQRFEQILFDRQSYELKGIDPGESIPVKNAVSELGDAIFNKVGDFKKKNDQRMSRIDQLVNSKEELNMKNLMQAQWQVSMFSIETTLVSQSGEKVNQGIQALFRNQ